jgi:hypothetical protein
MSGLKARIASPDMLAGEVKANKVCGFCVERTGKRERTSQIALVCPLA